MEKRGDSTTLHTYRKNRNQNSYKEGGEGSLNDTEDNIAADICKIGGGEEPNKDTIHHTQGTMGAQNTENAAQMRSD